jgi:hypothetical protein
MLCNDALEGDPVLENASNIEPAVDPALRQVLETLQSWDDRRTATVERAVAAYERAAYALASTKVRSDETDRDLHTLSGVGLSASARLMRDALEAEASGDVIRGDRLLLEHARLRRAVVVVLEAGRPGRVKKGTAVQ